MYVPSITNLRTDPLALARIQMFSVFRMPDKRSENRDPIQKCFNRRVQDTAEAIQILFCSMSLCDHSS